MGTLHSPEFAVIDIEEAPNLAAPQEHPAAKVPVCPLPEKSAVVVLVFSLNFQQPAKIPVPTVSRVDFVNVLTVDALDNVQSVDHSKSLITST